VRASAFDVLDNLQVNWIEDQVPYQDEQKYDLEEVEYHMTDIDEVTSIVDNSKTSGHDDGKQEHHSINNLHRKLLDCSLLRNSVI